MNNKIEEEKEQLQKTKKMLEEKYPLSSEVTKSGFIILKKIVKWIVILMIIGFIISGIVLIFEIIGNK